MASIYFCLYIVLLWIVLFICSRLRPVQFSHIIIGITTVAYSLTYEIILGGWLGLYFYLDKKNSNLYMVLAGVLIYPVLNILYILFISGDRKKFLPYTGAWIVAMLIFEYIAVKQKIIIITGWKAIPWSLATYAFTYLWINLLHRHIERKNFLGKVR